MLEKITIDAKRVFEFANGAARAHEQTEVGTIHILLGMERVENCAAAIIMMELDLRPHILRQEIAELIGVTPEFEASPDNMSCTPPAELAMQNAQEISQELGSEEVDTAHLLLGLISLDDDASNLLLKYGITEGAIRTEMARYKWSPSRSTVESQKVAEPRRASIESEPKGNRPGIAPNAYVHPTAVIIGNVRIGQNVFVGPNAVIRADEPGPDGRVEPVIISEGCNVQDGVVIHAVGGARVDILPWTSLAHNAVVHGPCKLGPHAFVGFSSVVYGATVGENSIVLHGAVVDHCDIPPRKVLASGKAITELDSTEALGDVTEELTTFAKKVSDVNGYLAKAMRNRVRT